MWLVRSDKQEQIFNSLLMAINLAERWAAGNPGQTVRLYRLIEIDSITAEPSRPVWQSERESS